MNNKPYEGYHLTRGQANSISLVAEATMHFEGVMHLSQTNPKRLCFFISLIGFTARYLYVNKNDFNELVKAADAATPAGRINPLYKIQGKLK